MQGLGPAIEYNFQIRAIKELDYAIKIAEVNDNLNLLPFENTTYPPMYIFHELVVLQIFQRKIHAYQQIESVYAWLLEIPQPTIRGNTKNLHEQ